MKWKIILTLLVLFPVQLALAADPFPINQFKGLNTDDEEIYLKPGQTSDSENTVTDDTLGLSGRQGYTRFSTQTSRYMWVFPHSNGNTYMITLSSGELRATIGGSNFTILFSTVSVNEDTVGTTLGDRFYFANRDDGLKYSTGSVAIVSSTTMKVNQLVTHKGRLFAAGRIDDPRTIYGSAYLNGDDWTLKVDPVDTDPVRIQVQGSLDEPVTSLFSSFKDLLIWGKLSSFGGIYGSRRSNFSSRAFSESVGITSAESIRDCDGKLRFMDSKKKVWEFDGTNYNEISKDINTLLNTTSQAGTSAKSWTQTTQGDFESGTRRGQLSTTYSPGDIFFNTAQSPDDDFDDGDLTNNPTWTGDLSRFFVNAGNLSEASCSGPAGSLSISRPSAFHNSTWTFAFNGDSLSQMPGSTGEALKINFMSNSNRVNRNYLQFNTLGEPADMIGIRLRAVDASSDDAIITSSVHKNVFNAETGRIAVSRDNNNVLSLYRITGVLDYVLMGSATATKATYSDEFFIYNGEGGLCAKIFIASVTTQSEGINHSTFTSIPFNVGGGITQWGTFTANHSLDGATIGYQIYSDTDTSLILTNRTTFISSQSIVSGQIPTITTAAYVVVAASFSRTNTTYTATLNDFQVTWQSTATLKLAGGYVNNRYWLGVSVSSVSNNKVLVYDRNNDWHKYSIPMNAGVFYKGAFYFGNDSGIFQAESGYTDNGAPIIGYYKSKNFTLGVLNYKKTFDDLYMTTTNNGNTLQSQYYVDGVNTAYSFANYTMNGESGIQDFLLPFPFGQLNQGKLISFKWTVSGSSRWSILNGNLYYTSDTIPSD